MASPVPSATLVVREHGGRPFYEAKFRHLGVQVKRRIGPAWLEPGREGWQKRRGRVKEGHFDERGAHVEAARLVAAYVDGADEVERLERERATRGATFREAAQAYVAWLRETKGAKRSTQLDYGYLLAEPGSPARRGAGRSKGVIMELLGERPAALITVRDVEAVLKAVADAGGSARSVNKHRALLGAIFNYGMRESTFALPSNPAAQTDKRREPPRPPLAYYSPEEVEALARGFEAGRHRDPSRPAVSEAERDVRAAEDAQDAALVRVASYAGLRQGELLALRWRDVDFTRQAITVSRSLGVGGETSTKSGRVRRVPLPAQAAAPLEALSRRQDFIFPQDLVFPNALGRHQNASALRRRFKAARNAAGLRPLRFHDLRHTYGSLLAAAGVDLVSIQAAMGHSALATTGRYLHARDASQQASEFTRAFEPTSIDPAPAH